MLQRGKRKTNWKFIILTAIILLVNGCSKSTYEDPNIPGSGNKSNLPVKLEALIEHAEYSAKIYENGSNDEIVFEVQQNSGITIIVIRGTANENNALTDLDARIVQDDELGIYLHKGFLDASSYVLQAIDNTFQNNAKKYMLEHTVHITGHSLGGAIAQILGMWLHKRGHNVQIFSYGSPKVSTQVLSGGQPTHWRVVRISDPVTFVPPYPFSHTGTFVNAVTLDWGPDNDNGLISKTDALDHPIAKYVEALKSNL